MDLQRQVAMALGRANRPRTPPSHKTPPPPQLPPQIIQQGDVSIVSCRLIKQVMSVWSLNDVWLLITK